MTPQGCNTSGLVIWFTGLPGAGKSTLGRIVAEHLELTGFVVDVLDGDDLRQHLTTELGYSRQDRDVNVSRIAWVASRLSRAGAAVVVCVVSPYAEARALARAMVEQHTPFIEVHVATSLGECIRRDPKGLYQKALAGEIIGMTGIDDPYEAPSNPDIRVTTELSQPGVTAGIVVSFLARERLIPG